MGDESSNRMYWTSQQNDDRGRSIGVNKPKNTMEMVKLMKGVVMEMKRVGEGEKYWWGCRKTSGE